MTLYIIMSVIVNGKFAVMLDSMLPSYLDLRQRYVFCSVERNHGRWSNRELAQDVPLSERKPTAAGGG